MSDAFSPCFCMTFSMSLVYSVPLGRWELGDKCWKRRLFVILSVFIF